MPSADSFMYHIALQLWEEGKITYVRECSFKYPATRILNTKYVLILADFVQYEQ